MKYTDKDKRNYMKKFVLTGYEKATGKMNTQVNDLDFVFAVLNYTSKEAMSKRYKVASDLEFDIMSRRSHNGAVIIQDDKYSWSIFLLK